MRRRTCGPAGKAQGPLALVALAILASGLVVPVAPVGAQDDTTSAGASNQATLAELASHATKLPTGWEDSAKFIFEKVTGAMIGTLPPPAGKFASLVLDFGKAFGQDGGKGQAAQLAALQRQLDAIQSQLRELQDTMNAALQAIKQTEAAVVAERVKDLRDLINNAEGNLQEAFSYIGQPDKKSRVDGLLKLVTEAVEAPVGGLAAKTLTIPEAILGSAITPGVPSLYRTLGDLFTSSHTYIFTWRDSIALENVFQYLIDLQALQYNLIVQVAVMQGSSADQIYQRYSQPLLGNKDSFRFTDTDVVYTAKTGYLYNERASELRLVPSGMMVDTRTGLEWSTDIPGGARDLTLTRTGKGVPTCTGLGDEAASCVTDPHYSVGPIQPVWNPSRWPSSPAAQLASTLAAKGYGALGACGTAPPPSAQCWDVPTQQQLASLFVGYSDSHGSAKAWLEQRSNNPNPQNCKPDTAGGDVAIKNPDTCLWPATRLWPTPGAGLIKDVYNCHGSGLSYRCDVLRRRFLYGWPFPFISLTEGTFQQCDLVTKTLEWGGGDTSPPGSSLEPTGQASCSGALVLVRQVSPDDRYYF